VQAVFLATVGLGITDAVIRFTALNSRQGSGHVKGVILTASRFSIASGALATALLCVFSHRIALWFGLGPTGEWAVILAALASVPTMLGDVLGGGFRGLNRMWVKVVASDLSKGLATFAGYALLGWMGWAVYVGAVSVQLVAAIVSAGLIFVSFRRVEAFKQPHVPFPLRDMLTYSVPLFVSSLIGGTLVGNSIPLVLATQNEPGLVSIYAIALTIQPLIQLPAIAVENAAVPVWAAAVGRQSESRLAMSYANATRSALLLALLVYIPLSVAPLEFLQLLFGNRYTGSSGVVQIALAATMFAIAVGPNEGMLRALGLTRAIFVARLVAGLAALGAAWPLIRQWGVLGAIIAWAISGVLSNFVYGLYLFRTHHIQPIDSRYMRTLAAGAAGWLAATGVAMIGISGLPRLISIVATSTAAIVGIGFLLGAWHLRELTDLLRGSASSAIDSRT
jgi:O-antigen/teichoic acid export membrane protein